MPGAHNWHGPSPLAYNVRAILPQDMVFPLKLYLFYHPFKSYCPPWPGKPPPMAVYDGGFGHFLPKKVKIGFLAFFSLQRPKMTLTQKIQKKNNL